MNNTPNKVFICGASYTGIHPAKLVRTNILGQSLDLPYFKVFGETLLPLEQLYAEIDRHIQQAMQQAGWERSKLANIPLFIGSTAYTISDCEYRLEHHQPLPTEYSLAVIADELRHRYQTEVFSLATSCTSSAQGMQYATRMIAQKQYDKALVIGFETFNHLTFVHFQAMHLLATELPYQPLVQSNGIVLGEGIGCVALSSQKNNEKTTALGVEMLGVTSLTDHHNLTNNSEMALRQLLHQCLAKSGLTADKIAYIKLHGVGGNADGMEIQVLSELFPQAEWISAKPYLGHTLGASGALETAFLWQYLQAVDFLPQFVNPITDLPLADLNALKSGYILHYFLGFGGSNVAWILKWENEKS